jgi:catechol 2,3-dioxygenase-like lactoylglutathione lyase family enzyme
MVNVTYLCPLIQVFDMPTSMRFYRDRLGFELVESSGSGDEVDWVWLRLGEADLMLNTAYEAGTRPEQEDPVRRRAHRDTGLFFGCPDVDAAYADLQAKGLDVKAPEVQAYGMKQLYVDDPDGYVLCFQAPA